LAGIGATVCLWLVVVFLPHRADYLQYVLHHSLASPAGHPDGLVAYLLNTFTVGFWTGLMPRLSWVALIGFVTLPVMAVGRRPALHYLGLWFALALLMLGYMNYRPDRYELVLLPALIAGFAVVLARIVETGVLIPRLRMTVVKAGLYALWLWILVTQLAFHTKGFWGALSHQSDTALLLTTLAIAAAASALGYAVVRITRNGLGIRPLAARAVIAVALLVLAVRLDLAQYSRWYGARTHAMVKSAVDLDSALPADAVLVGNWAPALLVGSRHRAVPITDWANSDDPVRRFNPTHLVSVENGFDLRLFSQLYPDVMSHATVFRLYHISGTPLLVYELPARRKSPLLSRSGR